MVFYDFLGAHLWMDSLKRSCLFVVHVRMPYSSAGVFLHAAGHSRFQITILVHVRDYSGFSSAFYWYVDSNVRTSPYTCIRMQDTTILSDSDYWHVVCAWEAAQMSYTAGWKICNSRSHQKWLISLQNRQQALADCSSVTQPCMTSDCQALHIQCVCTNSQLDWSIWPQLRRLVYDKLLTGAFLAIDTQTVMHRTWTPQ